MFIKVSNNNHNSLGFDAHSKERLYGISFTLYPARSRVGRGNLVFLRLHSPLTAEF